MVSAGCSTRDLVRVVRCLWVAKFWESWESQHSEVSWKLLQSASLEESQLCNFLQKLTAHEFWEIWELSEIWETWVLTSLRESWELNEFWESRELCKNLRNVVSCKVLRKLRNVESFEKVGSSSPSWVLADSQKLERDKALRNVEWLSQRGFGISQVHEMLTSLCKNLETLRALVVLWNLSFCVVVSANKSRDECN